MLRIIVFISFLAGSVSLQAATGDQDNDGRCAGDNDIPGVCISNPRDTDDNNPDVDADGICDGIRAVVTNTLICMMGEHPGTDTDGDGVNDELENADADGDGIPDYLDPDDDGPGPGDSDGDGVSDRVECGGSLPCRNSDRDGAFDYRDLDSDNDGLSDDLEADHIGANGGSQLIQPLDIDGDGSEDFRDTDADNDGRIDADELPISIDQDLDGIPDVYDFDDRSAEQGGGDSDNDGLNDAAECPVWPGCPDGDDDGTPDYLDSVLDTDDDGIPDSDEDPNADADNDPSTQALDTDQDGDPDYRDADSDNDGLLDRDERSDPFDASRRLDTDGDGIPDVVDFDGRLNSNVAGGDSDADGVADALECPQWPQCLDSDGDGIYDYVDSDSSPPPPPEPNYGEVSTAVNGVGAVWWLLLLAPLLWSSTLLSSMLWSTKAVATESTALKADWYASVGAGRSQLEPDTSGSLYRIDQRGDWGYRLAAGWDINHHWSLEGYYSDLGEARLAPKGRLGYRAYGVSLVGSYWLLGGERLPWSLALTGRGGIGSLSNRAQDLAFEQQSALQLTTALGLELYLPDNFSAALQVDAYDTDATLLSLNLTKRFGSQQSLVYAIPQDDPLAMFSDLPPTGAGIRLARIEPLVVDSDGDDVLDDVDRCLSTPFAGSVTVDEFGCARFQGGMEQLQFEPASARLTAASLNELRALAAEIGVQMQNFAKLRLQVRVHTDSQGSDNYNRRLSQQRAESVVSELLRLQIDRSRLSALGLGERQPLASNRTPEGRQKNRRVEFVLTGISN